MFKNMSFVVKPVKDKPTNDTAVDSVKTLLVTKQYAEIAKDLLDQTTMYAVITIGSYFTFKTASYVIIFGAKRLFR